jgi:hypothetical protein
MLAIGYAEISANIPHIYNVFFYYRDSGIPSYSRIYLSRVLNHL